MRYKQTLFKILKYSILITIGVYISTAVLLTYFQRSFIYFPSKAVKHGLKEIVLQNHGEHLDIISSKQQFENAILYFGGNAEAVYANYNDFSHYFKNETFYLVNYRGYGGSSGIPTEKALYEDALLIYDTLKTKHKNITVIGRSLGSGVATYLASKRRVNKLILITPFDSLKAVAKIHFPFYPVELMLFDTYNSIARVKDINAKTLILIAREDKIIPQQNSLNLNNTFEATKVDKKILKGYGHNDIQLAPKYYTYIQEFLKK
ncbi:alpha/beta hydrolase [Sulfurimonas sp.]|uniref:alpha/beta hydrolase n=1 Tax=Sulfurimonas sp. TaxID=2022749 RepID=UPI003D0A8BD1